MIADFEGTHYFLVHYIGIIIEKWLFFCTIFLFKV